MKNSWPGWRRKKAEFFLLTTGRLIDGKVFDTTEGDALPALFVVRDLIMGWQIALTRMHEGDKWEIYTAP